MTNEEIEAVVDRLRTLCEYFCQAVEMEDGAKAQAMDDINALCAEVEILKAELAKRPSEADEELLNDLADFYDGDEVKPIVDELARRLAVMWELCEADYESQVFMGGDVMPAIRRIQAARVAYRAMKEEGDAQTD